jgi:hypothetical protein
MDALIEAGTLTASLEERTVTGLLVPYNELGRSNLGRFAIDPGAFTIPRDPSIVTLNRGHDRTDPIGRATVLSDTPAGIVATFAVADTPEGDEYLIDTSEGKLTKLSAEVKNIVLRSGHAIAGALFGGAAVEAGAFPSAALLAQDTGSDEEMTQQQTLLADLSAEDSATIVDLAGQIATLAATGVDEADGEGEDILEAARVPSRAPKRAAAQPKRTSLREVAVALALFHSSNDRSGIDALAEKDASTLFGALVDVTVGANPSLMQPQWIGDVWAARSYSRKITPLLTQATLTSLKVTGFRFLETPRGGPWAGNKTDVPSHPVTTEEVIESALRWAGANDIGREFTDFSTPEFWASYFTYLANDYAKYSDTATLDNLLDLATPVTAGAVPSGVGKGIVTLIDGAIAVIEADGTPTFGVVASDVYRDLLLTGVNDVLATLTLAVGLEEGTLDGFKIVPDSALAAGTALVGDKAAATFYELPGVPIRTTALDQIKGGVDEAAFGYFANVVNNLEAVVLVTPAVAGTAGAAGTSERKSRRSKAADDQGETLIDV